MLIAINDQWRIRSTPDCWQVETCFCEGKRRARGESSTNWRVKAYCISLESAMNTLYERRVRGIKGSDLEKIIEEVQVIKDEIRSVCRKLDLIV